jgi:hypothetical protein
VTAVAGRAKTGGSPSTGVEAGTPAGLPETPLPPEGTSTFDPAGRFSLALHDLALAAATADRVVVVREGRTVAAGGATEVLTPARLRHIWGADARLTAAHGRTGLHVAWLGPETTPLR